MIKDSFPKVTGHVTIKLIKDGKVTKEVSGSNIWTASGRQFLSDIIRYPDYGNQSPVREDKICYIGVGKGVQTISTNITELRDPIGYNAPANPNGNNTGDFLKLLNTSSTSSTSSYTGVTFEQTFTETELLTGGSNPVVLTEVGLFTNGNENNSYALTPAVTSINAMTGGQTKDFAPMAYKTFEPITKTSDYSLQITWQVRFS